MLYDLTIELHLPFRLTKTFLALTFSQYKLESNGEVCTLLSTSRNLQTSTNFRTLLLLESEIFNVYINHEERANIILPSIK